MIYCIRFSDLERHLASLGFPQVAATERTVIFARGGDVFTVRAPPLGRDALPEMIANDALENAGLQVPDRDLFWCD